MNKTKSDIKAEWKMTALGPWQAIRNHPDRNHDEQKLNHNSPLEPNSEGNVGSRRPNRVYAAYRNTDDHRSIQGYLLFAENSTITWNL